MSNYLLLQVLLVVSILAIILLIIVLLKSIYVLDDINQSTNILRKRSKQLDEYCDSATQSISNIRELLSGFTLTYNGILKLKDKLSDWAKESKEE